MKIIIQPQPQVSIELQDEVILELKNTSIDNRHWQYASFLWVTGAFTGNVTVSGIDLFDDVPEKRLFEALQDAGVLLSIHSTFVRVKKNNLTAFQFSLKNSAALYLPLIILATQASGTSVLSDVSSVENFELFLSRITYLQALGIELSLQDDLLIIKGEQKININEIPSSVDAALLLTAVILSFTASVNVSLNSIEPILEFYPAFIDHINSVLIHKMIIE